MKEKCPKYFGGMYVDDKNNAVILTTDTTKSALIKRQAGSNKVIIKPCLYPYQNFVDLDGKILSQVDKNPELMTEIGFRGSRILEEENCIEICLKPCTPAKINSFKSSIADSPLLRFVEDSIMIDKSKAPATKEVLQRWKDLRS